MRKWLKWILIVLLAFYVLLFIAGGVFYYRGRPLTNGTLALSGLQGNVTVTRDSYGIPHIIADKSDLDAFFALGYVEAQDRFWQMEFQRHVVKGTLSEMFGSATLSEDKYLRTWGFYRAAESAWPAFSTQSKEIIKSYTAGINAYIQQNRFPIQLYLLGYHPKPWTVIDSIAWQKMMAWNLQNVWGKKLKNAVAVSQLGAESLPVLFPAYPKDAPVILGDADLQKNNLLTKPASENPAHNILQKLEDHPLLAWVSQTEQAQTMLHAESLPGKGSNSWVVSGRLTQSGEPLLANDPHLGLQAPAVWYLVDVKGPTLHVTGAAIPGLPGVVIGHNDNIAWGVTNVNPNVQDLYILPETARVQVREETIKVRGKPDEIFSVMTSDVGPVISTVTPTRRLSPWVALKWTALMPNDTTVQSMIELNYASDWSSFVNALKDFVVPTQNFIYADTKGNIGDYAPGHIPIRTWPSYLPVSDDSLHQWSGFIPFDKLPHVLNPESGMIVSANNRLVSDNYPYQFAFQWPDAPYRAERILALLHQKDRYPLTIKKFAEIQNDTVSLLWRYLSPVLLKTRPLDKQSEMALQQLKNWHGDMTLTSIDATIFAYWYRQLANLTPPAVSALSHWPNPLFIAQQLRNNGQYCVRKDAKDCNAFLSLSLQLAMQHLIKDLGNHPESWQWQKVHKAVFSELGFGGIKGLGKLWQREISTPGGLYTVNVGTYNINNFVQTDGASYRQIVDLSDLNQSLFIQTLGQSNDFLSPNYSDEMSLWRDGKYLPMSSNKTQWGHQLRVLHLVPKH